MASVRLNGELLGPDLACTDSTYMLKSIYMLKFDRNGYLPVGDHEMAYSEIIESVLVCNPARPEWDHSWRLLLLDRFMILAAELWQVGITDIFLDGSYVEEKDHPNDIDGYFVCDFKRFIHKSLHRDLNALNPDKIWTWSVADMERDDSVGKRVLPMWKKYRVELFPDYPGSFSGIRDRKNRNLDFPQAFRSCRGGRAQKGIVKLRKETNNDSN